MQKKFSRRQVLRAACLGGIGSVVALAHIKYQAHAQDQGMNQGRPLEAWLLETGRSQVPPGTYTAIKRTLG